MKSLPEANALMVPSPLAYNSRRSYGFKCNNRVLHSTMEEEFTNVAEKMTKQNPQKQRRKAHRRKKRKPSTDSASTKLVTELDVAQHVSSQYLNGGGGFLSNSNARRKRMEKSHEMFVTDPSHKKHAEYLKKLDRHPALVLNADYQPLSLLPLSLWTWQDTIKAVFSGKVTVVDVYPDISVRAVNLDVPLPSVIALNEFSPQKNQRPAFTRRNVFLRDGYRCQYCSNCFKTQDLSLDHVIPRCMGGKLEWANAVTCCRICNGKKGSRLPADLRAIGMKLMREPRVPTSYELAAEAGKLIPRRVHPTWKPFLGLDVSSSEVDVMSHGQRNQERVLEE